MLLENCIMENLLRRIIDLLLLLTDFSLKKKKKNEFIAEE